MNARGTRTPTVDKRDGSTSGPVGNLAGNLHLVAGQRISTPSG